MEANKVKICDNCKYRCNDDMLPDGMYVCAIGCGNVIRFDDSCIEWTPKVD